MPFILQGAGDVGAVGNILGVADIGLIGNIAGECCCGTSCEYELCDPISIKYCKCVDDLLCIFVDPAVLSMLEPPPGTIEISGVCYSYVCKSLDTIDTFAITSEPLNCSEPVCNPL
jgi:hypothetical protein